MMTRNDWTADELADPADTHWDVERAENGPVYNPRYLLIVRHRSGAPSRVVLSTSDWERAHEIEAAVRRSLATLSHGAFLGLLGLSERPPQDRPDSG